LIGAKTTKLFPNIAEMKINIRHGARHRSKKRSASRRPRNELMGFIGREEGIAAMARVRVSRLDGMGE